MTSISTQDQLKLSTLWRDAHIWVQKGNNIENIIARVLARAHAKTLLDEYFDAIERTIEK